MHARILWAMLALGILLPSSALAGVVEPVAQNIATTYGRTANEFASAFVVDVQSGKVLYEFDADLKWPAASLTKLMGALVFIDRNVSPNTIVALRKQDEVGGGRLRVNAGATMTIRDMLYSSITGSANNAATALARISGLGMDGFITAMNRKARAMGLKKTTFVDASGMSPKNVSTARDLAALARVAFAAESIRRPATTAKYGFKIRNTGEQKILTNTNDLLVHKDFDDLYVTGGKTGFLYESMYNLVVRLKPMGAKGSERLLMVVVLGAPTRNGSFKSAKGLAEWAWKEYSWGQ